MLRDALGVLLGACVGLAGCLDHIDAPSAYAEVAYPCDDPVMLAARVEACSQSASCAGVVGLYGILGGTEIVVDAPFDRAVFILTAAPGESIRQIDRTVGRGTAAHFFFALEIESLGGAEELSSEVQTIYQTSNQAATLDGALADRVVGLGVRVITDGETHLFDADDASSYLTIDHRSPGELGGTFSGYLADVESSTHGRSSDLDGSLRGCFLLRASERRLVGTE